MAVPLDIASMGGERLTPLYLLPPPTHIFNDLMRSNICPGSPFSLGVSGREREKNLMLILLFLIQGMSNVLSNIMDQRQGS